MCKPADLLNVTPMTTIDKPLPYSERTMRVIAHTTMQWVNTIEPRSVYARKFMQEMEPWLNTTDKGKMTTRIVNYLFKHYDKAAIPPLWQQAIGNYLASEAPTGAFHYDITNTFNWSKGEFGDGGSCFFSSRRHILRMLEDVGGVALRFWKKNGTGIARAFLLAHPDDSTVPILFNAYGCNIDQYMSRLRVILDDVPMRMVYLENKGSSTGDFYINQNMGVVIGSEGEDWTETIDFNLDTSIQNHRCDRCSRRGSLEGVYNGAGAVVGYYCSNCAYEMGTVRCELSGSLVLAEDIQTAEVVGRSIEHPLGFQTADLTTIRVMPHQLSRYLRPSTACEICHRAHPFNGRVYVYHRESNSYKNVCYYCATSYSEVCRYCGCYLEPGVTCDCPETQRRGSGNTYTRGY